MFKHTNFVLTKNLRNAFVLTKNSRNAFVLVYKLQDKLLPCANITIIFNRGVHNSLEISYRLPEIFRISTDIKL